MAVAGVLSGFFLEHPFLCNLVEGSDYGEVSIACGLDGDVVDPELSDAHDLVGGQALIF